MFHKLDKNIFCEKLEKFELTFDDGLYNHFYYYPLIERLQTKKVFFISTKFINQGQQSKRFLSSYECHQKAFLGNYEDFMNLEQIQYIFDKDKEQIGGHSHFHKDLNLFKGLKEKIDHIKMDTEYMLEWFEKNLKYTPKKFCFPYNNDLDGLYKTVLLRYGFTEFYGKERLSIDGNTPI